MAEDLSPNSNMGFQVTHGGLSAKPKMGLKDTNAGPPISIWWDYENCEVMHCADAGSIANNIIAGLTKLGLSGPLTIYAYGDVGSVPPEVSEALNRTGISMIHVAPDKNSTDMRMVLDMCLWAVEHPPPATYMLISGDKDFSTCLHRLRNLGYDILLSAFQNNCSSHLVSAAHHFLPWTDICQGAARTSTVNYFSPSPTATKHGAHGKTLKSGSHRWIMKNTKDEET